ncbi:hypothetical protein [Streptomyces sp. NPDC002644]
MTEQEPLFYVETHVATDEGTEVVLKPVMRSKASERRQWKQDALFELDELSDLYPNLPEVRL